CAVVLLCATTAIGLPAQTLTTLHSFDGTDGSSPQAALVQGADGNFYGTTVDGGVNGICRSITFGNGCGTVFKITPSGTLTTLYNFCVQGIPSFCTDDANTATALLQATNENYYG